MQTTCGGEQMPIELYTYPPLMNMWMLIYIVGINIVLISWKKKLYIHKTEANGQPRSWNESIHCLSDKFQKYIFNAITISLATPLLKCQLDIHDSWIYERMRHEGTQNGILT